ncbi:MAG TPA: DUF3040 domain-containing protein [Acidimicrobiales bacterium]|nr:DUF3040 domain-containing protein [Acidimicrobiales bacterium]
MPLSEHEQRILTSLEESLESDARFTHKVDAIKYSTRRRQVRFASVFGFILGLAILVAFFTHTVLVGIIGVAFMLVSSLCFVETLTHGGRRSG